ncbi:MAG: ABC transporter ATP-binding protein [Chloroflexi bacterium]|nr:ABC transporter ATP-binding protein [Chloroflexota bacterium]
MVVIAAEHVSKFYPLNRYRPSLRHEALSLLRGTAQGPRMEQDGYWALRDVSFEVQRGESVALVGRNGAGKTTLLRILSRITAPTEGRVQVTGRAVALIGLSAGFDMEHSGRQNIFLNAAILNMPPKQVRPLIDEIIAFAELEEFIDLPVKTYSSGMVARLGFSIAVHVMPNIIFLDEVLSVGDSGFQQKCIAKLHELRSEDRTFVIVSHAIEQVHELAKRAIWLDEGQIRMDDTTQEVIEAYRAETVVPPTPPTQT